MTETDVAPSEYWLDQCVPLYFHPSFTGAVQQWKDSVNGNVVYLLFNDWMYYEKCREARARGLEE